MKKKIAVLLLAAATLLALAGCACEHDWTNANCTTAKTCSLCQETEGEPLGHKWKDATCAAPETCETCGETKGEALPHTFADATCEEPKTCTECGATEGDALGHEWIDATYDAPKTCSVCEETEGEALVRSDLGMDKDTLAAAINTVLQVMDYDLVYLGDDEEGWPVFDIVSISTEKASGLTVMFEPAADSSMVYAVAIYSEDIADVNSMALLGMVATATILCVDENFDTDLFVETLQGTPQVEGDTAYYIMDSCGLYAEMQITEEFALFWVYPVE